MDSNWVCDKAPVAVDTACLSRQSVGRGIRAGFDLQAPNTAFRSAVGMASTNPGKAALLLHLASALHERASASRDNAPTTLRRLTPTASISAAIRVGSAALITTFKGLPTACTDCAHGLQIAEPRRVKHVGAGLLEGLQAFDGIVQIGPTADQILGTRNKRERHRQAASHLDACSHALDRVS